LFYASSFEACKGVTTILTHYGDVGLLTGPVGGISADGNIPPQRKK